MFIALFAGVVLVAVALAVAMADEILDEMEGAE